MDNPFRGLTEEQHCKGWFAKDRQGNDCSSRDNNAVSWCAQGVMNRTPEARAVMIDFMEWIKEKNRRHIAKLNDDDGWTFAQFEQAWDRWQSEVGK